MTPRPYQSEALQAVSKAKGANKKNVVVKLPTGMGKTIIFALAPSCMKLERRIMVLVHRDELAQQAADKIRQANPGASIGIEMGDRYAGNAKWVVGSVQTLGKAGGKRLQAFAPQDFDMLIIDECHHAIGDSYKRVIDYLNTFTLGVSATINRSDGRGLNEVFHEIVYSYPMIDGINQGWLVPLRGVRVNVWKGLDAVGKLAGDLNRGQLTKVVNTPECNAQIVQAWKIHGEDRQTVVFCVDVAHAQDLAKAFEEQGVKSAAIWGEDKDRRAKLKDHRAGNIKVVCNCEVLTEGYDDWTISCIVMARATCSESLYTQMVGRGTRIEEGINNMVEVTVAGGTLRKTDCVVIDCVGNSKKHSLVTLPSLFGMSNDMDLKGRSVTQVAAKVQEITSTRPTLDPKMLLDAEALEHTVEQFDMFDVESPSEVIQLSELLWHRTTDQKGYVVLLKSGEAVTVFRGSDEKWWVAGKVSNASGTQFTLCTPHESLEEGIKEADYQIHMLGGKAAESVSKRKAPWHTQPPDIGQLTVLKRWGIKPPPGATKGDIHKFIQKELAKRRGVKVA